MSRVSIAGAYATLRAGDFVFYYGYGSVDDNAEWCFGVKFNGIVIYKQPVHELDVGDKYDCAECLLSGIGEFFERFEFEFKGDE